MVKEKKNTKTEVETKSLKMAIVGQYLKDMSFENPMAPEIFKSTEAPKVEIDVNVVIGKDKGGEDLYESVLQTRAVLKQGKKISFVIEVAYAGLVEIKCDDEDAVKSVLLTEVPKLLFPYVRQIVSNISVQGGFPPLNLAPINFDAIKNNH